MFPRTFPATEFPVSPKPCFLILTQTNKNALAFFLQARKSVKHCMDNDLPVGQILPPKGKGNGKPTLPAYTDNMRLKSKKKRQAFLDLEAEKLALAEERQDVLQQRARIEASAWYQDNANLSREKQGPGKEVAACGLDDREHLGSNGSSHARSKGCHARTQQILPKTMQPQLRRAPRRCLPCQ